MVQPTIFVSYSHKDELAKEQLLVHLGVLQQVGLIDLWSDDRIAAGRDWQQEIDEAISQAKVAILLITANFLTSEFILNQEVPLLLRRQSDQGLAVIPLIGKACAWKRVDWLARMNVKPKNGKPIWSDGGSHADEDLAAIAEEIADVLQASRSLLEPIPPDSHVAIVREPALLYMRRWLQRNKPLL